MQYVNALLRGPSKASTVPKEWLRNTSGDTASEERYDPSNPVVYSEAFTVMSDLLSSLSGIGTFDWEDGFDHMLDLDLEHTDLFSRGLRNGGFGEVYASQPSSAASCQQLLNILLYDGLEDAASTWLPLSFCDLSGCETVLNPIVNFPPGFSTKAPSQPLDFAVVNKPFSSLCEPFLSGSCNIGPMSVALLMAIKGGKPWDLPLASHKSSCREASADEQLQNLSLHVEPNLLHLLMACKADRIRQAEQQLLDANEELTALPFQALLFGLMYDSQSLKIVAFIPFLETLGADETGAHYGCAVYVARTYPFGSYAAICSNESEFYAALATRLELAIALRMLRKHCFGLTIILDNLDLPAVVRDYYEPPPSRPPGYSTVSDHYTAVKGQKETWEDYWSGDSGEVLEAFWWTERPAMIAAWLEAVEAASEQSEN